MCCHYNERKEKETVMIHTNKQEVDAIFNEGIVIVSPIPSSQTKQHQSQ
jgi:hypothetical protein